MWALIGVEMMNPGFLLLLLLLPSANFKIVLSHKKRTKNPVCLFVCLSNYVSIIVTICIGVKRCGG